MTLRCEAPHSVKSRKQSHETRVFRILETFGFQKRLRFVRKHLDCERLRRRRRLSVVDVGCGTGESLSVPLAREGHWVVGVDVHLASLQVGRRLGVARFACAETHALRAGSFDAAICSEVLEHISDPQALLADIRRLLRPGGLCIVTVPNGYGPYEAATRAGALARPALGRLGVLASASALAPPIAAGHDSLNHSSTHVRFFTTPALRFHFAAAGFDEVVYEGRTFLCGPVLSEVLALHGGLVRANEWAGTVLPSALVSGWMFVLRSQNAEVSGHV
jgi:2-polyprenyl-3-methyl-5-hydroxy-6-metoxy-1,4-benzoquinol methylase